jgi:hypothetical protein
MKLVDLAPRILQIAQSFLVVFLDFLPNACAIHPHERPAVIDRMVVGSSMVAGLWS